MNTKIMPVTDLRRKTREVIEGVSEQQHIVYITQHGRPSVAIVDYELAQLMLAALQESRQRQQARKSAEHPAAVLLQEWLEDGDPEEHFATGRTLIEGLDENRLSYRKLFPPELEGITW